MTMILNLTVLLFLVDFLSNAEIANSVVQKENSLSQGPSTLDVLQEIKNNIKMLFFDNRQHLSELKDMMTAEIINQKKMLKFFLSKLEEDKKEVKAFILQIGQMTEENVKKLIIESLANSEESKKPKTEILEPTVDLRMWSLFENPFEDLDMPDYFDFEFKKTPTSCSELKQMGHNETKIYLIQPKSAPEPFKVLCDMDTWTGGWTYVLSKFDGRQDFYRDWESYKKGFGDLNDEFWLGLEKMYYMTNDEDQQLFIELTDSKNVSFYAVYNDFKIGTETEAYALKRLGLYSGNAGDSLTHHLGMGFSTKDKGGKANCAKTHNGAWWYKDCMQCQLTGNTITWVTSHGKEDFKGARILIRPLNKEYVGKN